MAAMYTTFPPRVAHDSMATDAQLAHGPLAAISSRTGTSGGFRARRPNGLRRPHPRSLQPPRPPNSYPLHSQRYSLLRCHGDDVAQDEGLDRRGNKTPKPKITTVKLSDSSSPFVKDARGLWKEYSESLEGTLDTELDEDTAELPGFYGPDAGGALIIAMKEVPEENKSAGEGTGNIDTIIVETSDNALEEYQRHVENIGGPDGNGKYVPVGIVGMRKGGPDWCELQHLYVKSDERENGVGKHLVRQVVTEARALGRYRVMRLEIFLSKERALQIYKKFGFYPIPRYRQSLPSNAACLEIDLNTVALPEDSDEEDEIENMDAEFDDEVLLSPEEQKGGEHQSQ